MAIHPEALRTDGLEPRLAYARNKRHIQETQKVTLGPMPVTSFMERFLPAVTADRHDRLSSTNAFKHVPMRADNAARIYEPLVRCKH